MYLGKKQRHLIKILIDTGAYIVPHGRFKYRVRTKTHKPILNMSSRTFRELEMKDIIKEVISRNGIRYTIKKQKYLLNKINKHAKQHSRSTAAINI